MESSFMTNADCLDDRRYVRANRYPTRRAPNEAPACAHAIENSAVRRLSAANFVEAAVIIDASRDPVASRRFVDLIKEAQIIIEPVTEPQVRIARDASVIWKFFNEEMRHNPITLRTRVARSCRYG